MLSTRQRAYALAVSNGASSGQAARMAGYANISDASLRTQASRLANDPAIQQAIFLEREKRLQGPLASKALKALESVLDNKEAPPAARIQAAKWVLEACNHGLESRRMTARHPIDGNRAISDMTLAELETMVIQAESQLKQVEGREVITDSDPQTDPADSEEGDDE